MVLTHFPFTQVVATCESQDKVLSTVRGVFNYEHALDPWEAAERAQAIGHELSTQRITAAGCDVETIATRYARFDLSELNFVQIIFIEKIN